MKEANSHSKRGAETYAKQTMWICLFIIFIIFSSSGVIAQSSITSQKISCDFCKRVEKEIVNPMNPVKIYHSYIFSDSCSFEFETKTDRIMIDLDLYETDLKASSELSGYLESFLELNDLDGKPKFNVVHSAFTELWDETFFYRSDFRDNFLLLRRHNLNITVISSDEEVIRHIESAFEKFDFGIYENK